MEELIWAVRLGVVLVVFATGLLLYAGFRWRNNIRRFLGLRGDQIEIANLRAELQPMRSSVGLAKEPEGRMSRDGSNRGDDLLTQRH